MAEKSTKKPNKRTGRRPKFEYKEIRKFESFEAFEGWWKAEGSEGLERDHSYRNSEGEEVEYFSLRQSRGPMARARSSGAGPGSLHNFLALLTQLLLVSGRQSVSSDLRGAGERVPCHQTSAFVAGEDEIRVLQQMAAKDHSSRLD
uniref:Uncharacterized protein n=1 Tax=Bursaphelenchus xylophilus TaxID=6326 RepID=A0A1I7SUS0_BURXY